MFEQRSPSVTDHRDSASETTPDTYFAPAGRDTPQELSRKELLINNAVIFKAAIDAMPALVLVLNQQRQVVAANRAMLDLVGCDIEEIIGKRPGEMLGCVNCQCGPDGCGTAHACSTCGAVLAILESQSSGGKSVKECRLLRGGEIADLAQDLCVTATQFSLKGESFTIFAVEDISDQKRLKVLNRIFFHDVLNTAGGISGLAAAVADEQGLSADETILENIANLSDQLIEEIQSQRDLMYAESNDLAVSPEPFDVDAMLQDLQLLYSKHVVAIRRRITLANTHCGRIDSDRRLLMRVLGNLLKNALEATPIGGEVALDCREDEDCLHFTVHNEGEMPDKVKYQVFRRSFSTKGEPGRGIGTYSIKLLTERYLHGTVSFTSTAKEGTQFMVDIPRRFSITTDAE